MKTRALLLVLALVVAACGGDDSTEASNDNPDTSGDAAPVEGEPVDGGQLVWGMPSYPEPIDPLTVFTSSGTNVASAIFDTLLTINAAGEVEPLLATSIDSPDEGTTWVIELADGVTFHDGSDFDAAAVVAHIERLQDPANECACADEVARITTVEATGRLEVTFTLGAPSASFPAMLTGPVGMVAAAATSPEQPIGTGPFTFAEARQDDSITVERYEDYWQPGLPHLDSVVYRAVPDSATRYAAIQTGELDMYWESTYQRWAEIRDNEDLQLIETGGFGSYYLLLNLRTEPFNDPDARLAVAKALDLETMHETLNAGEIEPATSIFPRSSWAYPGEIEDYPTYDLEGAKALVEELGGLEFSLLAPELVYDQAVAVQAMLQAADMDVEIVRGENLAMIQRMMEGDFQAASTAYSASLDPYVFASGYASDSRRNFAGLDDPAMDELVAKADVVLDRQERAEIFAQIAQRAAELLPFLVINNYNDAWVAAADIRGVPVAPDGILRPATAWRAP